MNFNFPTNPVEGQAYKPDGGSEYVWREYAWRRHTPYQSGSTSFPTRALFVAYVAQRQPLIEGRVYTAGGYDYLAKSGSTAIPDLPGLIPFGDVHVEHFGAKGDMTWAYGTFTTSKTGTLEGPQRLTGTDDLPAFVLADAYTTNTIRTGVFYAEADGYYIGSQFLLLGKLVSRRQYRNYLWLHNADVYKCNIWINSSIGGVVGFSIIDQYARTVAKPGGFGFAGPGITICSGTSPQGGPTIFNLAAQPILTDIEIDCAFCRAADDGTVNVQTSEAAYHLMVACGVEFSKFTVAPFGHTNQLSNGLAIAHWGLKYHGGDPITDMYNMVVEETYHTCDSEFVIRGHFDQSINKHGFGQALLELSSAGTCAVSDISVKGVVPITIQPGDAVNYFTNPRQKDKVMKGIRVGYVNAIDVPLEGEPGFVDYTPIWGQAVNVRGFGTLRFAFNKYDGVNRHITRQLDCDVAFKGINIERTSALSARDTRGIYCQGVRGKLDLGAISTRGVWRGYEIEYCDGDQQLTYVAGDGCLLYEFSRGGRLLETDTDRGAGASPAGAYAPGGGVGTKAVSVGGGTLTTTTTGGGTTTMTPIVVFPGADDDLYIGTPLTFTTAGGVRIQTVTATEYVQGRSAEGKGPFAVTLSNSNPAICTTNSTSMTTLFDGMTVLIAGAVGAGMTVANGEHVIGSVGVVENTFTLVGVDTSTGAAPQTTGVTADTVLPGIPYLFHTPLAVPAAAGETVVGDETARVRSLSLTSTGSETGLRIVKGTIDNLDMHGLKSSGKYGAIFAEARCTMKGALPLTVGATAGPSNATFKMDSASLLSASDGTILKNPQVARHFEIAKDSGTGATGHVELRNMRIEDVTTLLGTPVTTATLRYVLSMYGCMDYGLNQLLSHPGRQGNDANGYYTYGDDGILRCWIRVLVTAADGTFTWTFPAPFNGGAATVAVTGNIYSGAGVTTVRTLTFSAPTSTSISGAVIGGAIAYNLMLQATGRWFAE